MHNFLFFLLIFEKHSGRNGKELLSHKSTKQDRRRECNGCGVYNLFYDSISGRPTRGVERETCLNPFKDSSTTKATVPPVCLDYARGRCSRGATCRRLHRLPAVQDEELPHSVDIFGRQRSALGPASFLGRNSSIVFEKPANQQGMLAICKHIGPVTGIVLLPPL